VTAALKSRGVLTSPVGPKSVLLVTHHDANSAACTRAAEVLQTVLGGE
jgi:hypothetical protein